MRGIKSDMSPPVQAILPPEQRIANNLGQTETPETTETGACPVVFPQHLSEQK